MCPNANNLIKLDMSLHIRKKKNSSRSINIQIIDRKNRGYKVVETVGCAKNAIEKQLYLDIASSRLIELNKQIYLTLFDRFDFKLVTVSSSSHF